MIAENLYHKAKEETQRPHLLEQSKGTIHLAPWRCRWTCGLSCGLATFDPEKESRGESRRAWNLSEPVWRSATDARLAFPWEGTLMMMQWAESVCL